MSMTKKEKAAFEAAIKKAETLAALRWTQPVERDVPPPSYDIGGATYTEGWDYNIYNCSVGKCWSEYTAHGSGEYPGRDRRQMGGASQGARRLFSTEAKAWAAMRHELEQKAAESLWEVDNALSLLEP